MTRGIVAALPDGSGIYAINGTASTEGSDGDTRFVFCPNYKDCKDNIDETQSFNYITRTKGTPRTMFVLHANGKFGGHGQSRTSPFPGCTSGGGSIDRCGALIQMDGWEIKDDYPW